MKTKVNGVEIEYGVSESTGIFETRFNGSRFTSKTLEGLRRQIKTKLDEKPLSIPVICVSTSWRDDSLTITKGIVTGFHSGNGNVLVRWGKNSHSDQEHSRGLLKGDVNLNQLRALFLAKKKANEAYDSFVTKNGFDKEAVINDIKKQNETNSTEL